MLILCALYPEANYLIEKWKLKKTARREFQEFISENGDVTLALTGTGPLAAAAVTSACLSGGPCCVGSDDRACQPFSGRRKGEGWFDHILNFGMAASLHEEMERDGGLYRCHTLLDLASGRAFYPDLLLKMNLPTAACITGSQILHFSGEKRGHFPKEDKEEEAEACEPGRIFLAFPSLLENYDLYDMEAYAVARTASMYLGPHQMTFLKVVSDAGRPAEVTRQEMTRLMEDASNRVAEIVEDIERIPSYKKEDLTEDDRRSREINEMAQKLCCSVSMKQTLTSLIRYAEAADIDWRAVRDSLPSNLYPAATRKMGKEGLQQFSAKVRG
ncbi:MAG: hypothetical protein VZR02_04880 [Lachnospiraceae bacterium]|nr:hypothetical protein [Lachnospiraceae bacterium]